MPVPSLSSHVKVQEKNEVSGLGVAKKNIIVMKCSL